MIRRTYRGLCCAFFVAAVYFFILNAVKYNLAVSSAVLEEHAVTVIVDAGHGGEDGGTTSVSGALEKTINLAVAKKVEQLLAFCGIRPLMIRDTDVSVYTGDCDTLSEKKVSDLKNRVATINAVENALVVSIHQNHFPVSKYKGAQVFYAAADGSKALAQQIQTRLCDALSSKKSREIKAADSVYLMKHIQCPGVLVECGFLSNPQEDILLQDDIYQRKIACVLAGALAQYLAKGEPRIEV